MTAIDPMRLTLIHAKYQLLDTFRSPTSVVMGLLTPVIAFAFFILPQRSIADNPVFATESLIGLCVFGVMANCLFGFAFEIAQFREKPWGAFMRTLPGSPSARLAGYVFSTGLLALLSTIPLLLTAMLATKATIPSERWVTTLISLVLTAVPFMFISMIVGYLTTSRTAIATIQLLMLSLAFGGGLLMPPALFPDWLNTVSTVLPARQSLELTLWGARSGEFPIASFWGWLAWTFGTLMLATLVARRECGKRSS